MRKIIKIQFVVLLMGTLFAWGNFIWEFVNWISKKSCEFGCSAGLINPFLTPCFYGALFFSLSFILSFILLKKIKNTF